MIFVDRSNVTIPKVLDGPESRGTKETVRAIAHYSKPNQNIIFKFKVYSDRTVKEALIELFNDKCAYCESKVSHVYSGDVEHFRPKGEIDGLQNPKPGYYWLGADWDNLLFSCRNCNQKLKHQIHGSKIKVTMGKMNQFPLTDEAYRVRNHAGPTTIHDEEPYRLLMNPCIDDPEEHFDYDQTHAIIKPKKINGVKSQKAEHSIEVYVLQRVPLVLARERILIEILAQIQRVKEAVHNINENLTSKNSVKFYYDKILKRELTRLQKFTNPTEEYSGMARQIIHEFLQDNFDI